AKGAGMFRGNHPVIGAPDHEGRLSCIRELPRQHIGLLSIREERGGQRRQCLRDAVEPLVFEHVLNELSVDETGIIEKLFEHWLEVAARSARYKTFDVSAVNVL